MKLLNAHCLLVKLNFSPFLTALVLMIGGFANPITSAAAGFAKGRNVDTKLVSNWAQAEGDQFFVAVIFEINENWHTYWKNPGTTGMATEIQWDLPTGMRIESIHQSLPRLYNNEGLIDYIHEESAFVIASIRTDTLSKDSFLGKSIKTTVDWLECETLCVPGHSELELALSDQTQLDAVILNEINEISSAYSSVQKGTFSQHKEELTFQFPIDALASEAIKQVYFFPETPINDAAAEQVFTINAEYLSIKTNISPYGEAEETSIPGWLQIETNKGDVQYKRFLLTTSNIIDTAAKEEPESAPTGNIFLLLALAFLGGMILNLMPCVFPVIGLKIMGFVEQAGQDKRKIMLHGLIFTTGVLVSFWGLSAVLLLLRAGGEQLGWGFQLQEPWFNYGLILLMFTFALSLNGVFEFGMSAIGVGSGLQRKSGIMGSFFSGVLATVVATPCSAPFLAPALGAALSLNPWQAMLLFTSIALGLSSPYLLLSIFPGTLKFLPKPGAWMETFKQFMAFPLYGTVAYLLWALLGQIDDSNQLNLLLSLALFAMAFWVYGRWAAPHNKRKIRHIAIACAMLMVMISVWMGYPKQKKAFWEPWSPETVARYVEDGRTVYVDFTARWCATCQLNKRVVFGSEEVLGAFKRENVVALKADWTNRDDRITERLKSLGKAAVPVNLVYKNGEHEPVILPEVLKPGIVLKAINAD